MELLLDTHLLLWAAWQPDRLTTLASHEDARGIFAAELASRNFPNGIGGFARPSDFRGVTATNGAAGAAGVTVNRDARQTAEFVNAAQHWAVEHTRLGIPMMHEEALHGYAARGAPAFRSDRARQHLGSRHRRAVVRLRRARRARAARPVLLRWSMWRAIRAGVVSRRPTARTRISSATRLGGVAASRVETLPLADRHVLATLEALDRHG